MKKRRAHGARDHNEIWRKWNEQTELQADGRLFGA